MLNSAEELIAALKEMGSAQQRQSKMGFGIEASEMLGVRMPDLRKLARQTPKNHNLAQELWSSGLYEARILASLVDVPKQVTAEQMDAWAQDFDSWEITDQVCINLFVQTPLVFDKIREWSNHKEEYVKRAAYAMLAGAAVHLKAEPDDTFRSFFPIIEQQAQDHRNFVKKAVNWALRQIGKRNPVLLEEAMDLGKALMNQPFPAARWIGKDAVRELNEKKVRNSASQKE